MPFGEFGNNKNQMSANRWNLILWIGLYVLASTSSTARGLSAADCNGNGIEDAVDVLGARNTRVALMTLPCMAQPEPIPGQLTFRARSEVQRVDAYNRIVAEVARNDELGAVVDLASVLCPGGAPIENTTGTDIRYDGVHVTPDGSAMVAEWLFAELDRLMPTTR